MLTTCLLTIVLSAQPAPPLTLGDIYREIATDPAAFDAADLDRDGRISGLEVDAYRRVRQGVPAEQTSLAAIGGYDANDDGALTPNELYPEADYDPR